MTKTEAETKTQIIFNETTKSSASCSIRQLVVDENGNIITNIYDFYAVPASSVPRNQIFGEVEQAPETA